MEENSDFSGAENIKRLQEELTVERAKEDARKSDSYVLASRLSQILDLIHCDILGCIVWGQELKKRLENKVEISSEFKEQMKEKLPGFKSGFSRRRKMLSETRDKLIDLSRILLDMEKIMETVINDTNENNEENF